MRSAADPLTSGRPPRSTGPGAPQGEPGPVRRPHRDAPVDPSGGRHAFGEQQTTPVTRTSAYLLRLGPDGARQWLRIALPGESTGAAEPELRDRVHVPEAFGRALDEALRPGTSVVVTADSLRAGATGRRVNVVEDSGGETPAR